MLRFEKVNADNLDSAIRVQAELFPEESGRTNLMESLEGKSVLTYHLVYDENDCVGITGIYSYPEDEDSAWLGWFGIREKYRHRHYGSETLRFFEKTALEYGFRHARVYTDKDDNDAAIAFYQANGYTKEEYYNPDDPACMEIRTVVFSKSLTAEPLIPWNNRNIHLTEQIEKQQR